MTPRIERTAYTVAWSLAALAYLNSLVAVAAVPAYPYQTVSLALLGSALGIGAVELIRRRGPRIGVWGFILGSVAIAAAHSIGYQPQPGATYPPLFHAVSTGFLITAFVAGRTATLIACLAFVPWLLGIRTEIIGPVHAALEAITWMNFYPMIYVGTHLVVRATADAEFRANALSTARSNEWRSTQRAFEQQRWNGLIHDRLLGCLRLCYREPAGATVPASARHLAQQAGAILSEVHSHDPGRSITDQVADLTERLGLTAAIDLEEANPAPVVATATVNAIESALSNVVLHAGPCAVTIGGRLTADEVSVRICDTGTGFDPESIDPRRMGVAQGIVRRMESVGGHGAVVSAPGAGTVVKLGWQNTSPWEVALAWQRRIFWSMVIFGTVLVLVQVAIGSLYLQWFDPVWMTVAALILFPVLSWALVLLPMGRIWFAAVAAITLLPCVVTLALLEGVPAQGIWYLNASQSAVAVMAFRYRAWLGPVIVVVQFAAMAAVTLVLGTIPWSVLVMCYLSLQLTAVAVAGARIALDRETRRIVADSDAQAAVTASVITIEERRRESSRRIAALAADVQPLLDLLTTPGTRLTEHLQQTCRDVEATLRDQLVAAALLNPALVAAVAGARAGEVSVEISSVGDSEQGIDPFREAAIGVLLDARPGEHVQIRWRPKTEVGRLGSIAVIGERPAQDWPVLDPDGDGLELTTSCDESSLLIDLSAGSNPAAAGSPPDARVGAGAG